MSNEIYDIIIIGAGPCGLATAARLRERAPAALFTDEEHRRYHWIGKYGDKVPLKNARNGKVTPELMSVRPNLLRYKIALGERSASMPTKRGWQEIKLAEPEARVAINLREKNDYYTPSKNLFRDHCDEVARRYNMVNDLVRKETVCDLEYRTIMGVSVGDDKLFRVTTNLTSRFSKAVVLAVGPANAPQIPLLPSINQKDGLIRQACHSMHIKQFPDPTLSQKIRDQQPTSVLIVGGGLTSAQLVDLAIRRGITKVWHVMRDSCRVKHFDVDLQWMGKYKNAEKARFWSADSDEERLSIIKEAPGGGSLTPLFYKIMKKHIAAGRAVMLENTRLIDAIFEVENGVGSWKVVLEPTVQNLPQFDFIYFASGIQSDFTSLPYLQKMLADYPISGTGGFPCINDDLMWGDDIPLFATGRLASLRLGPVAPNIGGAKLGAERIAWAIAESIYPSGEGVYEQNGQASGVMDYLSGHGNMYHALACDN